MADLIVLDIETNVSTGYPVVIAVSVPDGTAKLIRPTDADMLQWLSDLLLGDSALVCGHNIAFDFATLQTHLPILRPAIWSLYQRGRVTDTMVREKLIRCAQGTLSDDDDTKGWDPLGGYGLANLVTKYLGGTLDKSSGSWRMRFHELEQFSTDEWPQAARDYCLGDVDNPRAIWSHQLEQDPRLLLFAPEVVQRYADDPNPVIPPELSTGLLLNETPQVRAALALTLLTQGGISTDAAAVAHLRIEWTAEVEQGRQLAKQYFIPAKGSATRTLFDAADVYTEQPRKSVERVRHDVEAEYAALGIPVPLTKGGKTKIDEDTLSVCKNPALRALGDMTSTNKLLTSFLPVLEGGTTKPLHPTYDILKASGRTSAFGPNIQQLPRKGGVRECFIPRPGYTFIQADYNQIELCALAQAQLYLIGKSAMADAIRSGKDLHVNTAATLLGISYEKAAATLRTDPKVKEARQLAKAANFGYPGGMGPEKFVDYARMGYGLAITQEQSARLKRAWLRTYPEQALYFKVITDQLRRSRKVGYDGRPRFDLIQLVSGRVRGMCGFCDGSNTYFQGLAADGVKLALYLVAHESYCPLPDGSLSPLYGCVGGAFIHDEIILEAPITKAAQAAKRLGQIMVAAMQKYIPDVPIKAEPLIMPRLYKAAEPRYDAEGNLIPWTPGK